MQDNQDSFINELQTLIDIWIKEKPNRTVADLAQSINATNTTVQRLLRNRRKIVHDLVFNILAHIFDRRDFEGIVESLKKHNSPVILQWFIQHYSYLAKVPALQEYRYSTISDRIASDVESFSVSAFVYALERTPKQRVVKELDLGRETKLDRLIEQGILCEDNDYVYVKDYPYVKLTKEQVARLLPELCEVFFKPNHSSNVRHLEIRALSPKGYKDLINLHFEFAKNMQKIFKKNPGDIPVIAAGFCDTLTKEPYFKEERK